MSLTSAAQTPQPSLAWTYNGTLSSFTASPPSVTYVPAKYQQGASIASGQQFNLNLPSESNITTNNGFTICVWCQIYQGAGASYQSGIKIIPVQLNSPILNTIGNTNNLVLCLGFYNGWKIGYFYNDPGFGYREYDSSIVATVGTWYHFCVVFGGSSNKTMSFYINGSLINSTAYTTDMSGTTAFNQIYNFTTTNNTAAISDLRLYYNTALSAAQVLDVYSQQGVPGAGVLNTNGNVFYAPFDGSLVVNGVSPSQTGTITFNSSSAKFGQSVVLKNSVTVGSNYISYPMTSFIQRNLTIPGTTCSTWFKINSIVPTYTNDRMQIFNLNSPSNFGGNIYVYYTYQNTNYSTQILSGYTGVLPNQTRHLHETSYYQTLTLGQWYHYCISLNSINYSVYFNGQYINTSDTITDAVPLPSSPILYLGTNTDGSEATDIELDDFRVYNYPLSAQSINALYNLTVPSTFRPPSVVASGAPLFSQLSAASQSSAVGAFSLRAVNGITAKAVQVQTRQIVQWPPVAMTSNTTTISGQLYGNGTYTALSSNGCVANQNQEFRAFDYNVNSYYEENYQLGRSYAIDGTLINPKLTQTTVSGATVQGDWLQLNLPTTMVLRNYTFVPRPGFEFRCPRIFWIAGSNDGTTWSNVHFQTGITGYTYPNGISFTVPVTSNSLPYSYYRVIVNAIGAGTASPMNITSWNLYGESSSYANTSDFYADRLGNLLTVPVTGQSLASWLGGATGYVTTWYDQSGKGNHATQSTVSNQPIIQKATKGPGYSCLFNGSKTYLIGMSYTVLNNTNYSFSIVERRNATGGFYVMIASGDTTQTTNSKLHVGYRNDTTYTHAQYSNDIDYTVPGYAGASEPLHYWTGTESSTSGRIGYHQGSQIYNNSTTAYKALLSSTSGNFYIGVNPVVGGLGNYYPGELYEILVFTTSLYDLDTSGGLITQIYQNQLSYTGT